MKMLVSQDCTQLCQKPTVLFHKEAFFSSFWRTQVIFVGPGATDTSVLDFWWCLLWVSKPEWSALFTLGWDIHATCSLRFTSGVTPADLLVASMAAELFSFTYLRAGIVGDRNRALHEALPWTAWTVWRWPDPATTDRVSGVSGSKSASCNSVGVPDTHLRWLMLQMMLKYEFCIRL